MFAFVLSVLSLLLLLWVFRQHLLSLFLYLATRIEPKKTDFRLLSSLRDDLVHERKKKTAGLEMILSSWEKGTEIEPRHDYFDELMGQLKTLLKAQRRNLMAVTDDVWTWAKLWNTLRRTERMARKAREKSDTRQLRASLSRFQELLEQTVGETTNRLSFTLNEVVEESVKIVAIEKSQLKGLAIKQELDQIGDTIRLSYGKSKNWQRTLVNLIRNAVEAVEARRSGARRADPGFSRQGGLRYRVVVSTEGVGGGSISVIIEDFGIGMDEATRSSFYRKGFSSGKESGLGLGVTEESVQLIEQYGTWEIESEEGVGTRITINIDKEKARKAELILPPERPFYRRRLALGLSSAVLLAMIGSAFLFTFYPYSRIWVDWNPGQAKLVGENNVIVETKTGDFLWDRILPQKVRETCLTVADLDNNGANEVLVGTLSGSKTTGHLFCFSSKGKEEWRFALGAERIFQVAGNRYHCCKIIARDLDLDGETEILVDADNTPWFPHQIALLDKRGRLRSNYWHSGAVSFLVCEDLDDDGIKEIVFGGVNNRLDYSAVLGVLDHRKVWGQSPPYRDTTLGKAKEIIYVKFPFVRELGGENDRYSNVVAFIYAGKRDGSEVYHVTVADPGFQREYHLDEGLTHVKNVVVHPKYRFAWERMKREGMVDYDLSPEVLESWKEIEVWKNGVKVE